MFGTTLDFQSAFQVSLLVLSAILIGFGLVMIFQIIKGKPVPHKPLYGPEKRRSLD